MGQIIIAISGTSGAGKTTLAHELAKKYNLVVKPENIDPIINALKKVAENEDSKLANELINQYIQISFDWILERQDFIAKNNHCILDRCALDILNRFLLSNLFNQNSELIVKLIALFQTQSQSLTALIIPSLLESNVPPSNEDQLVRHSQISRRIHSHSCTIGLAKMYARCPILFIPNQMNYLESRVSATSKAIDQILTRSPS